MLCIQFIQDGSGEDTRLRIEIGNDSADDMELKAAGGVSVTGNLSELVLNHLKFLILLLD